MDESNYFKVQGSKFIYEGKDILRSIRLDIKRLNFKYGSVFVNPVPIMDKNGRLIFEKEEEIEVVNIPIENTQKIEKKTKKKKVNFKSKSPKKR